MRRRSILRRVHKGAFRYLELYRPLRLSLKLSIKKNDKGKFLRAPDGRGGESAGRHNQRSSNNREETHRCDVTPNTTSAASELPEEFFCSITQEVMKDPVFCSDGHTHERAAIAEWFRSNDTSPLTNARLASKDLVRNHALASQIDRAQLSY